MTESGSTSNARGSARIRDLWWQFAVRAVVARYRGSYLGILWALLSPLLMLSIYFVVFGIIFGGHFGVLSDFVAAVRSGTEPETTGRDNIRSLAMVFGAIESAEAQRRVSIDV